MALGFHSAQAEAHADAVEHLAPNGSMAGSCIGKSESQSCGGTVAINL